MTDDMKEWIRAAQEKINAAEKAHRYAMLRHQTEMQLQSWRMSMRIQKQLSEAMYRAAAKPIRIEL